jgi:hypothetical protein
MYREILCRNLVVYHNLAERNQRHGRLQVEQGELRCFSNDSVYIMLAVYVWKALTYPMQPIYLEEVL